MPFLLQQTALLDELAFLVRSSVPRTHSGCNCEFDYDSGYDDGSFSVGCTIWYYVNGQRKPGTLNDPTMSMSVLIPKLHSLMKEHTGGEWTSMTLTLDADGKATAKFHYPDPTDS